MNKKNDQKTTQSKNNIEIKIDAKSGKASGNLFKRNPVVSNNPSLKVGQKLSGKVVTRLSLIKNYCKAEDYHQKYLEK